MVELPDDALVELEGRGRLEQRIGGGNVFGVDGLPRRRAADGCDTGWCRELAEVEDDIADGRGVRAEAGASA